MLGHDCGRRDSGELWSGAQALLGLPWASPSPRPWRAQAEAAGQGLPLGLEMVGFSGEGRSVWATVHVNSSPDSQSSTHTVVSPMAVKVALGWLSEMLVWVFRTSPFWRVQAMDRLS